MGLCAALLAGALIGMAAGIVLSWLFRPSVAVPKIAWLYWQEVEGKPMCDLIRVNVRRSTQFLQELGWKVAILDEESPEVRTVLGKLRDRPCWKQLGQQAKSDFLRLSLLHRHGGLWLDAGIVINRSGAVWIDEARDRLNRSRHTELIAFTLGTIDPPGTPFLDSWFLLAKRCAPFLKLWKGEFLRAVRMGFPVYGKAVVDSGVLLSRPDVLSDYHTVHRCSQALLQKHRVYGDPSRRSRLLEFHDAVENDMYRLQDSVGWDPDRLATVLARKATSLRFVKLRGCDRSSLHSPAHSKDLEAFLTAIRI